MKDKLITKLKGGSTAAFEEIMNDYSGYVFAVVRNHSRGLLTREDMEELTADTFAALWLNRAGLAEDKPLMPWLAVTARNRTLNRLRTVRLTVGLDEAAEVAEEDELTEFERTAAEDILAAAERLDRISLEIFTRHYLYGEPLTEIAAAMKLGTANVRTKLFRAREKIRKILTERGYFHD